ncbi:hypothetical protein EBU99_10820 [bacterium]|nr:hypothetical protein [bacterium]
MVARIYSLLFVALMIVGFIYQESYMQMSLSEFNNKLDTDKIPYEVFSVIPMQLQQFKNGELTAEVTAKEARLVTTGRLTALGNVQLRVVDSKVDSSDRVGTVRAEKMIATAHRSTGLSFDLFDSGSRFERVEMPGDVEANSRGQHLQGKAFALDVPNMTLTTKEPVQIDAPNRRIVAAGLDADLRTRSFKLTGPVKGTEIPPARPTAVSKNKRSSSLRSGKVQEKRAAGSKVRRSNGE